MKSKSFCEDLTEGKFSFPILHAIRKDSTDTRILSILKQKTEDKEIKRYAQSLLKEAGSLDYTLLKCKDIKESVVVQIQELGGNPHLLKVLDMLHVQLDKLSSGVDAVQLDHD